MYGYNHKSNAQIAANESRKNHSQLNRELDSTFRNERETGKMVLCCIDRTWSNNVLQDNFAAREKLPHRSGRCAGQRRTPILFSLGMFMTASTCQKKKNIQTPVFANVEATSLNVMKLCRLLVNWTGNKAACMDVTHPKLCNIVHTRGHRVQTMFAQHTSLTAP